MPLVAADLFCGAGGFSEGFRQAGFRISAALDVWPPAIVTHKKNHPDTRVFMRDIVTFDPEDLGPVDVLIGSPPCTEFSFANRGGSGDIESGMRLVHRFLRFVYELGPRYWVMENVPRVLQYLPDEVPLKALGIDKRGSLPIPTKMILNAADYGAPQKRARAFSGDFPAPTETHQENSALRPAWRTLGEVLSSLPDPLQYAPDELVRDPIYTFALPSSELTDHFSQDLRLSRQEVMENRQAKESHSWYGRMSFPDRLDRPARTVMATNIRISRETIVVPVARTSYRRISVREASSIQGFPLTYQWWGQTTSQRYMLVGNAVAPPTAFAVARAILAASELPIPSREDVAIRVRSLSAPPPPRDPVRHRRLPLKRRFREHIPGSKLPGFRVDLDNRGETRSETGVHWLAVLYRGGGKSLERRQYELREAVELLRSCAPPGRVRSFMRSIARTLRDVPDASALQHTFARRGKGVGPGLIVERITQVTARHFGEERWAERNGGVVPARIAATLVATAYACALANEHPRRPRLAIPSTHATKRRVPLTAGAEARRSGADRPS